MPMINITTPTNPALGKSSSAIIQGGINEELRPFLQMGGAIVDQDPGISIAGGTRLGRHIFLRGPEEQVKIAQGLRNQRMTEYVNELLGQGFSKVNPSKLQKKEGGYTTTVNLNWVTGAIDSSTEATSSSRSSRRAASDAGSKYQQLISDITSGKVKVAGGNTYGTLEKLKSNVNAYYGGEVYTSGPKKGDPGVVNAGAKTVGEMFGGSSANLNKYISSQINVGKNTSSSKPKEAPSYANGGITFSGGTTQSKPSGSSSSSSSKPVVPKVNAAAAVKKVTSITVSGTGKWGLNK